MSSEGETPSNVERQRSGKNEEKTRIICADMGKWCKTRDPIARVDFSKEESKKTFMHENLKTDQNEIEPTHKYHGETDLEGYTAFTAKESNSKISNM